MTALSPIPFNKPCLAGDEIEYVKASIVSGHSSSGGPFTKKVEELLAGILGAQSVMLTTSCTDALEMSAMLLGIGPGDTVIVPSFTFTSTALAYARQGASLRFADIDPVTLCLDPEDVRRLMDHTVKAIITVHYAGVPSAVEELQQIATEAGAELVEDNAHGLFATHHGRPLGSFGRFATLSFHETKNFICGEGGALVLNDERDADAARILLDKGTNRQQFLDGVADRYTWQGLGSSFGLSDMLAAFLLAQLERSDEIRTKRRRIVETYRRLLSPVADDLELVLPYEPESAEPADHMFYVMLNEPSRRSSIIARMRSNGVHPTFHYVPLHSSTAGVRFSDVQRECPVTDDVSSRLLRLPFYNDLSDDDVERVVATLTEAMHHSVTRSNP